MILLVPGDVLRPRRPDEHFAEEAQAAREAGLDVAVIDHDVLARNASADAAVARVPADDSAIYRGWMLRSEQYEAMAQALARRGVELRTSAAQYRRAHELPGWYEALSTVTPESVWTAGDSRTDFESACARLGGGPAVLRDHTKSMKHYWHEAVYLPETADPAGCWTVASRFRELRGDDFTGGFVLRRFESFTGAEARTWWTGGVCRLVTAHPDTPGELPAGEVDLTGVAPLVAQLDLPMVTVDLALRADGVWRVVELGDGQVSDRPAGTPARDLITALTSGVS